MTKKVFGEDITYTPVEGAKIERMVIYQPFDPAKHQKFLDGIEVTDADKEMARKILEALDFCCPDMDMEFSGNGDGSIDAEDFNIFKVAAVMRLGIGYSYPVAVFDTDSAPVGPEGATFTLRFGDK